MDDGVSTKAEVEPTPVFFSFRNFPLISYEEGDVAILRHAILHTTSDHQFDFSQ